jgi:hypothetical protein
MIQINNVPFYRLTYETLDNDIEIDQKESALRNKLIWKVASTCLKEWVVGSLLVGTACCFMTTAGIPTLTTCIIAILACSALLHLTEALIDYNLSSHLLHEGHLNNARILELKMTMLLVIQKWARPYTFALADYRVHGTLIHECGHAFVAWLLFKGANPKIEILPTGGGFTHIETGRLSRWGQTLGRGRSLNVVSAAGAAFAILESIFLLAYAHHIKDSHPELRLYLACSAIVRVIHHIFYALSALVVQPGSLEISDHDFYRLWKNGGIHPALAAITMVAIPLLTQWALWKWSKVQH